MELLVKLKNLKHSIIIENDLLSQLNFYISSVFSGTQIALVTDENVDKIYGTHVFEQLSKEYVCHRICVPAGETSKNIYTLLSLYQEFAKAQLCRTDLVIALGGGVVGDLAGYAAATYMRGLSYIQIPTSLLAQIDSSVGGKTGIDLPEGKNLVGAFYQPKLVLIDPIVLDTLPQRYLQDGMGELIKYGCIRDCELLLELKKLGSYESMKCKLVKMIYHCLEIKRDLVEQDEYDVGERKLLNFGHTLAHGLEQYYKYQRYSHGEAVAIGMYQITRITEEKGLTQAGTAMKIKELLQLYGLPYESGILISQMLETISLDKKKADGFLNLVILKELGESYLYPTTIEFFDKEERI
ncbi:MAG: 3-dehydroquinate synthase [Lachnospiraceae bacterium]